jgi:hypothetical protein
MASPGRDAKPRTARTAQSADTGSSRPIAIAPAIAWPAPGADVVTSNHASTSSSVAVAAAVRRYLASRRISSIPVPTSPNASRLSSPTQAVDQFQARVLDGMQVASTTSHGIRPRPASVSPRASHPGPPLARPGRMAEMVPFMPLTLRTGPPAPHRPVNGSVRPPAG